MRLDGACCTLHNICEVHGDIFDDDWLNGVNNQEFESSSSCNSAGHPIQSATDTRNAFMAHFSQETTSYNTVFRLHFNPCSVFF